LGDGFVTFLTTIEPSFVFVKVQVIVSPGAGLKVAVRAPASPVPWALSHETSVRA
jgi:hypothetical protein